MKKNVLVSTSGVFEREYIWVVCMAGVVSELQQCVLLLLQEGMQVPVAIKTCKETSEETMTEKFLEEACKYASFCPAPCVPVDCGPGFGGVCAHQEKKKKVLLHCAWQWIQKQIVGISRACGLWARLWWSLCTSREEERSAVALCVVVDTEAQCRAFHIP